MKIHLERSGGFAGMIMSYTVDTDNLSSKEADELQDLIKKSQFFNLSSDSLEKASPKTKKGAADYLSYKVTVQDGDRQHTLEWNDLSMQPSLKRLVDLLVKHAKK